MKRDDIKKAAELYARIDGLKERGRRINNVDLIDLIGPACVSLGKYTGADYEELAGFMINMGLRQIKEAESELRTMGFEV